MAWDLPRAGGRETAWNQSLFQALEYWHVGSDSPWHEVLDGPPVTPGNQALTGNRESATSTQIGT